MEHTLYHVVVRGGSHFCQSSKGGCVGGGGGGVGEDGVFFNKTPGKAFYCKKRTKIPQPSPPRPLPRKNVTSPRPSYFISLLIACYSAGPENC